ncbi:MAG: hypothetical protein RBR35_17930 [Salinivirgaceae bacterium]|nr:hypothetical protein [Salinivirgaceae bacterium]
MAKKLLMIVAVAGLMSFIWLNAVNSADETQKPNNLQVQIDAVKAAIPKFAVPMREVGDRFQNMYFAAQGGNWGLAAYMSKYMNSAMNPAKLTKPAEYPAWAGFYNNTFAKVNEAITAQDFKSFEKTYSDAINRCNACHGVMGYGFIKVVKQNTASDLGVEYNLKSKATDVPK